MSALGESQVDSLLKIPPPTRLTMHRGLPLRGSCLALKLALVTVSIRSTRLSALEPSKRTHLASTRQSVLVGVLPGEPFARIVSSLKCSYPGIGAVYRHQRLTTTFEYDTYLTLSVLGRGGTSCNCSSCAPLAAASIFIGALRSAFARAHTGRRLCSKKTC